MPLDVEFGTAVMLHKAYGVTVVNGRIDNGHVTSQVENKERLKGYYYITIVNETDLPVCVSVGQVTAHQWCNVLLPGEYWYGDYTSSNPAGYTVTALLNPEGKDLIVDGQATKTWLKIGGVAALSAVTGGAFAYCTIPAGAWSAGAITVAGSPWLTVGAYATGFALGSTITSASAGAVDDLQRNSEHKAFFSGTGTYYRVKGGRARVLEGKLKSLSDISLELSDEEYFLRAVRDYTKAP